MNNCRICNAGLESTFRIREMMLGTREEFDYGQCSECGTIQILEIPESIESYYPPYYYSFTHEIDKLIPPTLKQRLFPDRRMRKNYRNIDWGIIKNLKPLQIMPSQKILDVGCGKGKLICELFNLGYLKVEGVDKYIDKAYDYNHGVKVFKRDLADLKADSYDLLMMHHVFEHMDKPFEELLKSYRLLKKDRYLIIRIPVIGKAWELYGRDWVQLDAPRHFFIHTEKSIGLLAQKTGFEITNVVYDSEDFQFWGSELYRRDISLVNEETKKYRSGAEFFSEEELTKYDSMAEELNYSRAGDQAIFYLRKP